MKKNGFISTSLIYTFFLLFLMLMISLIGSYSRIRFLLDNYKFEIKSNFAEANGADINLYIMVWDEETKEYELKNNIPDFGYSFEEYSYCKNNSTIAFKEGNISISSLKSDSCYAYFR